MEDIVSTLKIKIQALQILKIREHIDLIKFCFFLKITP